MRHPVRFIALTAAVLLGTALGAGPPARVPAYEVYAIRYAVDPVPCFGPHRRRRHVAPHRHRDDGLAHEGPGRATRPARRRLQAPRPDPRWKPADYVTPAAALDRFGVRPEAVTDLIISHVHWDHLDGADLFPEREDLDPARRIRTPHRFHGQRLANAIDTADAAMLHAMKLAGRVNLVDGDAREIIPGITVYTGGKHTFQSQYVGVNTAAGTVVLASDNVYLYENLEKHVPIAQTLDAASNLAAQERMTRIASNPRLIVPGHDPAVFERFPSAGIGAVRIQ